MPEKVFVRAGLSSPQIDAKAQKRKGALDVEAPVPDTDGAVVFESRFATYRLQLNTPRERFDPLTGQKLRDENRVIVFKHGLYTATTPEDVQAIVNSKFFGAPGTNSVVWRRLERQKRDVEAAVEELKVQLDSRPDLQAAVVETLSKMPGAEKFFSLPTSPEKAMAEL